MSVRASLVCLCLVSGVASAELPLVSVSGGWSNQVFAARAFDLVGTTDAVQLGRVAAAVGIPLPVGVLELEAAFATGGVNNTVHASVPVEFTLQGAQLGVAWRVPIFRWLQPYAQVGGGLDWVTLTLLNEARLTQTVLTGSGTGLLGVQFVVRLGSGERTRLPTLVFDLGAGAVLRPTTRFDALAAAPAEEKPVDPIAGSSVSLGSMPLSGFTSRLAIGVRY